MSEINPCMTCGACCAYFRVSFYWAEADDAGGVVPTQLTEPLTPFLRCMSGTNQRQSRCTALSGEIGESVHCTIYHQRPSPAASLLCQAKAANSTKRAIAPVPATACRRWELFTKIYLP